MDQELEKQMEEQFRQLNESLAELNAAMSNTVRTMRETGPQQTTALNNNTTAIKSQDNATKDTVSGTTKLDEINKDYTEKTNKAKENFASAFNNGYSAVSSFTTALLSSERGFAKYGNAIQSAGDAAWDVGKNFGILGMAAGGIAKLFGMAAGRITKQADDINNFADVWKKAGAVGGTTNLQLAALAREAGYASQNLEKLVKPIGTLGAGAVNLGGTMQEGQQNFMRMINVGPEVQKKFNRLGYQLEELNDMQAQYVKLQRLSGIGFSSDARTQAQIKKNSIEYAENLIKLSAITGENVDEIKKKQEEQATEYREMVDLAALQSKIARLEESGSEQDLQEAARLKEVLRARRTLNEGEASLGAIFGSNMGKQIQDFIRSGRINDENIAAFRLGGEELRKLKEMVDSGASDQAIAKQTQLLKDKMAENVGSNSEQFKNTVNLMAADQAEQLGKQFVGDTEFLQKIGAIPSGQTASGAATEAATGVDIAGTEGVDAAADFRANMTIKEQEAQKVVDELILSINPLLGNMGALKMFGIGIAAVTTAFLAFAAIAAIKGGVEGIKGMFGGADTPDAPSGSSGPIRDIPKVRKADLLDKRGKMLQGAALDARMEKLSREQRQSDSPILEALKDAGKNAAQVIKGGGALGLAIGAVGAGIAGAGWLMGGAITKFASGLKEFDKINGPNLKLAGIGMAGLGAGILAMGAGAVMNVINVLAEAMGAKSPLELAAEQLYALQALNLDVEKIQRNSDAFVAFGQAMAALGALGGAGEVYSSIAGSIAGFFKDEEDPRTAFSSFIEFSNLEIDKDKTKNNADAYRMFADAMASFKGMGLLDALSVASTALAEASVKFFDAKPPIDQFVYFSSLQIDPIRSFLNSLAYKDFATAMSEYRGSAGVIDTLSTLIGARLGKMFGQEGPIDAFVNFSKTEFGPNGVKNANAFFKFVKSLTLFAGGSTTILSGLAALGSSAANIIGKGFDLVSDLITGKTSEPTVKDKPKNVTLSNTAWLDKVNPDLRSRFFSAAKEYGGAVNINSGFRPDDYQAQLWVRGRILNEPGIFTPARPKNTQTITYKGQQYTVQGSGKGSAHGEGNALDITANYGAFDPYLRKYGLHRPYPVKDKPHVQKAAYGGVFENNNRGSSDRLMSSIDPNSVLMKLASTPAEQESDLIDSQFDMDINEIISSDANMRRMLLQKLDKMAMALDEGKSTSNKLLRSKMAS